MCDGAAATDFNVIAMSIKDQEAARAGKFKGDHGRFLSHEGRYRVRFSRPATAPCRARRGSRDAASLKESIGHQKPSYWQATSSPSSISRANGPNTSSSPSFM